MFDLLWLICVCAFDASLRLCAICHDLLPRFAETANLSIMIVSVGEQRSPDLVRRTLTIDGRETAFFEISGDVLPPALELSDFAAIASVFLVMREGRPLHIDGRVSRMLLRSLEELQEAWALWQPNDYRPVPITAAEEVDVAAETPRNTGVFAFSGGVDSVATLLRHQCGEMGRRTVRPIAAAMVHGFDIPLSEADAFATARRGAEAMLAKLNVPFAVVRTNWREMIGRRWEMEFGAGLAACLHQFAGAADFGVIGSDEDYAHLEFPWGSNPVTNHFLTGGAFKIQTDCGGVSRTDRVRLICRYPEVASLLRVCWEGPHSGVNCGKCEKCLRTNLNFLANGHEPLCFERRPTQFEILGIKARNSVQIAYLEEILGSARMNGVREPWVIALAASVLKNKALRPIRPLWSRAVNKGRRSVRGFLGMNRPTT